MIVQQRKIEVPLARYDKGKEKIVPRNTKNLVRLAREP